MAKVTKIKASDNSKKEEKSDNAPAITRKKVVVSDKKSEKAKREKVKKAEKEIIKNDKKKQAKNTKKVFVLFRPFVAIGRYVKESWQEIRQVRWPNRKTTWKMVLAVLAYTALFVIIISLLDLLFSGLFNLILSK